MNKISDIISTPVISLFEGEYIGIIYNILFDYKQKKCQYAIILDENENIPKLFKFSDIYKVGKNCIFIKNKSSLYLSNDNENEKYQNPINLKVFDLECKYLGTTLDIIINDEYKIDKIILNTGKEIESNQIFNIGKNVIIVCNNRKLSRYNFRPKQNIIKSNLKEQKVITLEKIISPPISNPEPLNNKILTDFRFLIGRILNKDITAINGEIIAKKNAIITKDIINKASSYGKLVEIARYSKN